MHSLSFHKLPRGARTSGGTAAVLVALDTNHFVTSLDLISMCLEKVGLGEPRTARRTWARGPGAGPGRSRIYWNSVIIAFV
jgi:hypothetical protein